MNALPESCDAIVNFRIDFLETVDSTLQRLVRLLEPIVASYNMTFDTPYSPHPDVKERVVRLSTLTRLEQAPITTSEGAAFELMSGTLPKVSPGTVVAPSAMIANTDTLSLSVVLLPHEHWLTNDESCRNGLGT